jgi:hypothetical protein
MKNIHLITTSQPSRLRYNLSNVLVLTKESYKDYSKLDNIHIYITSDEVIKDYDWYISSENKLLQFTGRNVLGDKFIAPKIILTTDQDLIKDGIQPIDDEFLEWFVNNPSCEFVEVVKIDTFKKTNEVYVDQTTGGNYYEIIKHNKIIIPNEEAKQRAKNYMSLKGALEPNQIKCYCGHTTMCDCVPLDEGKQERMYSGEDMKQFAFECVANFLSNDDNKVEIKLVDVVIDRVNTKFEQFKKK